MWIKKINVLIKDKEIGRRLGKNARELIVEKFNWDKLSKEFVDIIKPYINNKN